MPEINEITTEVTEIPSLPNVQELIVGSDEMKQEWGEFITSMNEYAESISKEKEFSREIVKAGEYGVDKCSDVTRKNFTPEIINKWNDMTLEQRDQVIQEYANGIGDALGINFKGLVWEEFQIENGKLINGYNAGDGYVHLNVNMLADPAQLMKVIDLVAHEAHHQFQNEVIASPEKFPIDEATVKEWTIGKAIYTTDNPTAYDPWGYFYNPMETASRIFGESMVRELTKEIINDFT